MNNRLYDFEDKYLDYTGQHYVGYKDEKGKIHSPYYGEDINHISINPDVVKLLDSTDKPKKIQYLKLPYPQMFISNKLTFKDFVLPYGLFIVCVDDNLESDWKELDEQNMKLIARKKIKDEDWIDGSVDYTIGFYYESTSGNGIVTFSFMNIFDGDTRSIYEPKDFNSITNEMSDDDYDEYSDKVWEDSGTIEYTKNMIKRFPLKEISEFLYKLLLFIDCPDVEIKRTEGRAKMFRKGEYDFFEPKKLYSELSHDLRKYIQEIKRTYGVKFKYYYKYIVRGHFRNLKSTKYKKNEVIWIKPYFKGDGKYIPKEKVICRNI